MAKLKFNIPIPPEINVLNNIFKKNGFKLYIVGGAVRDSLLKKPIKDYDLATDAIPDKVEAMLQANKIRTIATGKSFGVINVFINKEEYEIATFREDVGKGRRPDSITFTDIETDVFRRDLTINGLFYDIDTKEIIDFVGGIEDLKNKIVRTIGKADDRFNEDRLRILRSVRFAGRFKSKLDPDIEKSLMANPSLEGVSPERIRDEFIKGIKSSKSVVYFMELLKQFNLFNQILPQLNINYHFIENNNPIIVIAILLSENDPRVIAPKLNKLTYSTQEVSQISFLNNLLNLSETTAMVLKAQQNKCGITEDEITIYAKFMGISTKLIQVFNQYKLSVKGQDLMVKLNLKQGAELGTAIKAEEQSIFSKMLK